MSARTTEKLIALYRYEIAQGAPQCEMLTDLLDELNEIVLEDDNLERIERQVPKVTEAILRVLTELGHPMDGFVEKWARMRAACDAKNGTPREVPFDGDEQARLAAEWDAAAAAAETPRAEVASEVAS